MDGNEAYDVDEILDDEFLSTEDFLQTTILNAISHYSISNLCTLPSRTSSLSGSECAHELLSCGHNARIKEVLRMRKSSFDALVSWFLEKIIY